MRIAGLLGLLFVVTCCAPQQKESSEEKATGEQVAASSGNKEGASASKTEEQLNGEELYNRYCGSCHQQDGSGVPGMYPPLGETKWVNGSKERLIKVILNGLNKKIEVKGETYHNQMPANDYLSDEQIARILTYVRQHFDNDASPVSAKEVKALR